MFHERRQLRMGLKLTLDGTPGAGNTPWPLSAASTPTVPPNSKPRTPTSISAANTPASPSTHLDILQCLTLQSHTPTSTPTNESCPSLVSGSSAGNLVGGPGKHGALKAVLPEELAKRMRRPKPFLLLDCRPEFVYKMNHVYGAVNVNLTDRVIRRRLHLGKVSVCDVMTSREAKALYRKRVLKEVVIYDEKTMDWTELPPYDHLQILLNSLKNDGKEPAVLIGGFADFHAQFPDLCDGNNAMKMVSASQSILNSPTNSPSSNVDLEKVEASQILPFLFLGNERDASDIKRLSDLRVRYILNVTSHSPCHYEKEGIRYKRLPASDSGQQNLMQYFQEAFDFIDEARRSDCSVLIHCQAGVSRSATIVVAYVMHHMNLTMDEAYKLVKDKRNVISPNLNFMGQLYDYEKRLVTAAEASSSAADQQLPQSSPTKSEPRQGKQRVLSIETSL